MSRVTELLNFSSRNKLPLILQSEKAECGLACVAMISNFHGHQLGLSALRRRFSVSLKGATMLSLIKIANALQLNARPVKASLEALSMLNGPAILHWDLNHFVVLKSVSAKSITIHDPASGVKTLRWEDVSRHFTGIALELTPTNDFVREVEDDPVALSQFWKRIIGLPKTLSQILILSLFLQLLLLATPFYMQLIVDEVIVGKDLDLLIVLGLGFGLLVVINTITEVFRSKIILHLSSQINLQMGANLFRHLLHLPITFFEKRHIGEVISRFGSLDQIRELLSRSVVQAFIDGLMAIITVALMFVYSAKLSIVVLLIMAIYFWFRMILVIPLRTRTEEQIIERSKEQSSFIESVRGIQAIKMHGFESNRHTFWQKQFADYINADIKVGKLNISQDAANTFLFGLENVIVAYIGAILVIDGDFSLGMLFAFMAYKVKFLERFDGLITKVVEFRMLRLHLMRLSDIAYTEQEANLFLHNQSPTEAMEPEGRLTLSNVTYKYAESEPEILSNVSVEIKAGQSVAIVGPSGSGKTTLAKLMCGLFIPTSGEICFDEIDIRDMSLSVYRQHIAAVMQDDQLLTGSIGENISFFQSESNSSKVESCAQLASIHDDILSMPMKYNSLIGDMGTTLSGGQKQRVLLARALYRDPKILFLDEATSHLDIKTESIINSAIKQLAITRIIIAHRPETIRSANRILLLKDKKLIEISHDEWEQRLLK